MTYDANTPAVADPSLCQDMAQVRAGVDAIDQQLVALLAERFAYMKAAARIKTDRAVVRDEARKAQVIANVRNAADGHGLAPDLVDGIWEQLVEASIGYELNHWDALNR
jgi:isochorismate pyruvate lyase